MRCRLVARKHAICATGSTPLGWQADPGQFVPPLFSPFDETAAIFLWSTPWYDVSALTTFSQKHLSPPVLRSRGKKQPTRMVRQIHSRALKLKVIVPGLSHLTIMLTVAPGAIVRPSTIYCFPNLGLFVFSKHTTHAGGSREFSGRR